MTTPPDTSRFSLSSLFVALVLFLLGVLTLQTWLDTQNIAVQFLSSQSWLKLHELLGSEMDVFDNTPAPRTPFLAAAMIYAMLLFAGAAVRAIHGCVIIPHSLIAPLFLPAAWSVLDLFNLFLPSAFFTQLLLISPPFLFAITFALMMTRGARRGALGAGRIQTLDSGAFSEQKGAAAGVPSSADPANASTRRSAISFSQRLTPSAQRLLFPLAIFVAVSVCLNFGLYFNLRIPHGDSAMYEEHLWNLLHGKGFRSYLDQGLFLGEHIQFIHVLLIPVYVLFPSHLTLELCETLALASGAFPIYWMTRRRTGSPEAATALAICYLLYPPMHFLDIEIDLKTFRPEAFGIPLLLLTLDQFDRGRVRSFLLLLTFTTLTVKEDYAIVVSSLGLWMLVEEIGARSWVLGAGQKKPRPPASSESLTPSVSRLFLPLGLIVGGAVYLKAALATIVWFRSGVEVHYAGYFTRFGNSTSEIIWTMLTDPLFVLGEFATWNTLLYALMLLVPLAFLPLFTTRIIAALPLFVLLCLNEIASDPRHHFHAPIVPLLFWASATAGLPNAARMLLGVRRWPLGAGQRQISANEAPSEPSGATAGLTTSSAAPTATHRSSAKTTASSSFSLHPEAGSLLNHLPETFQCQAPSAQCLACFAAWSALGCALTLSLYPVSMVFWDPHSAWYWRTLYVPSERAAQFEKVLNQIPRDARDARVASTDFIHPRFTHHKRSYDYSQYRRKVAGDTTGVPGDTDYIVIDTQHPYSAIKTPEQVPQLRDHPDHWELLPDQTGGYYIILRRSR